MNDKNWSPEALDDLRKICDDIMSKDKPQTTRRAISRLIQPKIAKNIQNLGRAQK